MENERNSDNAEEVRSLTDSYDGLDGKVPKESIPIATLKEAIYLSDILDNKGVVFEVDESTMKESNRQNESSKSFYADEDSLKYLKPSFDEDDDDDDGVDRTPFERLALKMDDVSGDGGILKLLKERGSGDLVPNGAMVTFHYSAFLECADEPYDSTRLRGAVCTINLSTGPVLPGLKMAINTMRSMEVASFLVKPGYAYGRAGCPPRIPGDATILFNVELVDFFDYEAAAEFDGLSLEEQKAARFERVMRAAICEHEAGNRLFKQETHGMAIQRYRKAVRILENCTLRDENDEAESNKVLKKLYSNLALCCQKSNQLVQALAYSTKLLKLQPNNVKALYRRGVVKTMLHEYKAARACLLDAKRQAPTDKYIIAAILDLDEKEGDCLAKEKLMCSKMFASSTESGSVAPSKAAGNAGRVAVADEGFIRVVRERLVEFVDNRDVRKMQFPGELTFPELTSLADLVDEFGLEMSMNNEHGRNIAFICKPKSEGA